MEPPASYEELLQEYLKLREEKEQMNQVIDHLDDEEK